jgi:hypothetical protein
LEAQEGVESIFLSEKITFFLRKGEQTENNIRNQLEREEYFQVPR